MPSARWPPFNLGKIDGLNELEELADLLVRALDSLLDYQDYPLAAARNATMGRRPLGIGVINFAYYLAKNGARYSDGSGNDLTHKTFEAIQYYLLKASNKLAKEKGACPKFNETSTARAFCLSTPIKKSWMRSATRHCIWTGRPCGKRSKPTACVTRP